MLVDSPQTAMIAIDPRLYCETMNELHSYITSSKRGYLTQAELFRYYRQRHDNAEIPYRLLGYRCLLDLLSSDQRLFSLDLRREPACIYSAVKLRQERRDRQYGPTSFSRQHHSTNTLDEPQNNNDDLFFNERSDSIDRHRPVYLDGQDTSLHFDRQANRAVLSTLNENSLTNSREDFLVPSVSSSNSRAHEEDDEHYQETCETVEPPVIRLLQRKPSINVDLATSLRPTNDVASSLHRSISTSTSSLCKSKSFRFVDLYLIFCSAAASIVLLGFLLYKIC